MPADVMPRPILRDTTPTPLPQSAEFLRALQATDQSPLVLDRMKDTVVTRRTFSIPLIGRLPVAMVNRVRITKPLRLLEMLQEEGLGRTPVILSPEEPVEGLGALGALPLMSPARVAKVDLTPDQETRRAQLHQKWRNRLNHGERQGLRLSRQNMPMAPDHWLFDADAQQQAKRGYRSWPVALTLAYAHENKGMAKLFQAHDGKQVVAAILILRHGNSANYHIAHTSERGKQLSAHNLLLWEAMNWLSSKGCVELDLGIINTEDAPGLARFKLGTGANLHTLGGTWLFWPPAARLFKPLRGLDRGLMTPGTSGQV